MRQDKLSNTLRNKQKAFKLREFDEIDRREDEEEIEKKIMSSYHYRIDEDVSMDVVVDMLQEASVFRPVHVELLRHWKLFVEERSHLSLSLCNSFVSLEERRRRSRRKEMEVLMENLGLKTVRISDTGILAADSCRENRMRKRIRMSGREGFIEW